VRSSGAHDPGGGLASICQQHADLLGALDHVLVGDDVSLGVDDDGGAQPVRQLGIVQQLIDAGGSIDPSRENTDDSRGTAAHGGCKAARFQRVGAFGARVFRGRQTDQARPQAHQQHRQHQPADHRARDEQRGLAPAVTSHAWGAPWAAYIGSV
jgi:hypothetical protein